MTSVRVVEDEPELTLLDRASAGDEAAFTQIVASHHTEMRRVSFLICGDLDLAHDAVQQAWQIAWRKLSTVRDPGRLRAWLIAVAANEARQLVRGRRRRSEIELQVAFAPTSIGGLMPDVRNVDLTDALGQLKAEDRTLLALRYVAGFDSTEIARTVGGSASGVRTRLARLLTRLREDLTDG